MLSSRYSRAALIWGLLFVVSLAVFLFSVRGWNPLRPPTDAGPSGETGSGWETWASALGTITSCITAGATLGGLAWTVTVGWRREQRDAEMSRLERRRLENELEKQRLELERMRTETRSREES